jgi:hypothetical protein
MSSTPETILSMALIILRQRHAAGAVNRYEIAAAVRDSAGLIYATLPDEQVDAIVAELETRLVVTVGRPTTLSDERGHVPWYFGKRKEGRRFFRRYEDFLIQEQQWPPAAIEGIDAATDLVMEQIEDPERDGRWDRRGLIVGHVQSGKTANYAGLANKAADAGYKLIVVLAGMHNVLRQQTQRRLDRDVLGYDTSSGRAGHGLARIGVGPFDVNVHAEHLTTQAVNGDFNRAFADNLGMGVQQRPVMLVVKKNAAILANLNTWVREVLASRGDTEARPLLVIDDEADQASVDTGEQDFEDDDTPDQDYEPKRINGQIRLLLAAFYRKAYVAYTATPFANILIHDAAIADEFEGDLFPRSFIVNLPTPSDYVGASSVFGLENPDEDNDSLDVIRHVDQQTEGWIPPDHKKTWVPRYDDKDEIPPSLQDAIMAFVLVCAARAARGRPNAHNSMLVHVSRFKDVHQQVFGQVQEWLGNFKRTLRYGGDNEVLINKMKKMWTEDFERTSSRIRTLDVGRGLPSTTWPQVKEQLATAIDKIQPQVVNSERKDAIDYDGNAAQGLSIIAIGGDKLSRGLTLEGLSVSYFLRASRMYDTLMQMGRWFGYRPGYVDLCRLYTTPDLELWFRHVSSAAEELRERLDHMAMIGSTPETYGLRIKSHDILLVTAPNKMRHAKLFRISFQGESKIQTVFFSEPAPNIRNASTITTFLDSIGKPSDFDGGGNYKTAAGRRIWNEVAGKQVANLLGGILFPDEARDVNSSRLSAYIREQLSGGELTEWTIAVPSGSGETVACNGWAFATIKRAPLERARAAGRYVVKTILSPRDEAIDLSEEEYEEALKATNHRRAASKNKKPTTVPDGPEIRRARGKNPKRALLLLYPLSPTTAKFESSVPIFGVVVSFPDSNSGRAASYRFNTVEQRLEPA